MPFPKPWVSSRAPQLGAAGALRTVGDAGVIQNHRSAMARPGGSARPVRHPLGYRPPLPHDDRRSRPGRRGLPPGAATEAAIGFHRDSALAANTGARCPSRGRGGHRAGRGRHSCQGCGQSADAYLQHTPQRGSDDSGSSPLVALSADSATSAQRKHFRPLWTKGELSGGVGMASALGQIMLGLPD